MQIVKMKRVLACLLAAVLALPVTALPVSSDNEQETVADAAEGETTEEGDAAEETIEIEEEQEEVDIDADTVQKYMTSVGAKDGYAVYLRSKEYKDEVEAEFLAKVGSTYADEDEAEDAADEIIDLLKKAEMAIIEEASGKVAAVAEELTDHCPDNSLRIFELLCDSFLNNCVCQINL